MRRTITAIQDIEEKILFIRGHKVISGIPQLEVTQTDKDKIKNFLIQRKMFVKNMLTQNDQEFPLWRRGVQ